MTSSNLDITTIKQLQKTLKFHARALDIPPGAAEDFINRAITSASASLQNKSTITDQDLKRAIVKELKKYHQDLAYVYEIYDTII